VTAAVLVAGAANLDRMMTVEHIPAVGETVMATRYEEHPGGKGANQAAAAARWGRPTYFLGKLGRDAAGRTLREALAVAGVGLGLLLETDGASGLALDFVDSEGRYQAGVLAGANAALEPGDVPTQVRLWEQVGLTVLQLECPQPFVEAVGLTANKHGVPVLLNTAPATAIPHAWWDWISILIANEVEASALTSVQVTDQDSALMATRRLREKCADVIVTLGDHGLVISNASGECYLPAHPVEVVSTLGAGDAFVGVFAAEFCRGRSIRQCAEIANVAAAASVMLAGAQSAYQSPNNIYRHPTLGPALTKALGEPESGRRSPNVSVCVSQSGGSQQ